MRRINCICSNPLFENTPLFQASTNGHIDIVRLLIENGADVSKRGWVR